MIFRLPSELLLKILELALEQRHRNPIPLLLVNSVFHRSCLYVLQAELRFSSVRQLDCFVRTCRGLTFRPRALLINLPGGAADFRLFGLIRDLLTRIPAVLPPNLQKRECLSGQREIGLRRVEFCLNSHMFDQNCKFLFEALNLVDPEEFIWTGPDPAHHFSIAIVPNAASYLFKAMESWTNLRYLKLTNMAYHRPAEGGPSHPLATALGATKSEITLSAEYEPPSSRSRAITLPPMPFLQSIYLGQVTFLDPLEIALIACAPVLVSLTSIRVVDAYQGSIWGPRVRNADVEGAARLLLQTPIKSTDNIPCISEKIDTERFERVRRLVSCEALTERIMGGDRMDYDN